VNHPAIAGVHRIERNRTTGLPGTLRGALSQPLQMPFTAIALTPSIDHNPARPLIPPKGHLIDQELRCVERAAIATPELRRRRAT
jgi:hypothetical protein